MALRIGGSDKQHWTTLDERPIFSCECGTDRNLFQAISQWPRFAEVLKVPHAFVIHGLVAHADSRLPLFCVLTDQAQRRGTVKTRAEQFLVLWSALLGEARLACDLRSTEGLAVVPRRIETANSLLALGKHLTRIVDPLRASLRLFG